MSSAELWECEAYMLSEGSIYALTFVTAILISAIGSQLDGIVWC